MEIVTLCGLLGVCAWEDWKTKKIRLELAAGMALMGMLLHLLRFRISLLNILGGVAIGAILYGISILSKEQIGKGDALVFMGTGVFLGWWSNLMLLWTSLLLAGIYGSVYSIVCKKTKETCLPFLPFVFVSLVILALAGGLA
ncbi:MAG: prepilin peptidase [Lachnospiraceae bacterium]|nr:prepilin peptidase [Lachnospiraceae bacterium]